MKMRTVVVWLPFLQPKNVQKVFSSCLKLCSLSRAFDHFTVIFMAKKTIIFIQADKMQLILSQCVLTDKSRIPERSYRLYQSNHCLIHP